MIPKEKQALQLLEHLSVEKKKAHRKLLRHPMKQPNRPYDTKPGPLSLSTASPLHRGARANRPSPSPRDPRRKTPGAAGAGWERQEPDGFTHPDIFGPRT